MRFFCLLADFPILWFCKNFEFSFFFLKVLFCLCPDLGSGYAIQNLRMGQTVNTALYCVHPRLVSTIINLLENLARKTWNDVDEYFDEHSALNYHQKRFEIGLTIKIKWKRKLYYPCFRYKWSQRNFMKQVDT